MLQGNTELQQSSFADFAVPDFPRIRKVLRLLQALPPGLCVDIGYCRGSFADYLAERGWHCIGYDIVARHERHAQVASIQGDVLSGIPLADGVADLITAGELIEHLTDEAPFLQECRRVLRPGGYLALTTPNLAFTLNRGLVLMGRLPMFVYAPYHYRMYTVASLSEIVQANGFRVRRVGASHTLYSTRRHPSGWIFERMADLLPTLGAHIVLLAEKV